MGEKAEELENSTLILIFLKAIPQQFPLFL